MTRVTAAEAEERIEQDDGDPDDEVLVRASPQGGGRHCYHKAPDDESDACHSVEGMDHTPKRTTRRDAQKRGLAPCKRCILEPDRQGHDPLRYHRMMGVVGGDD